MNSYFKATSNKGLYDNKPDTFITTSIGRANQANWVVNRLSMNQYACYGMSDQIQANPLRVSDFLIKLRNLGVKDIGFIYSKASSVTSVLDKYQKSQTNPLAKFSFVISEIEQYKTGKVEEFYATIEAVSQYCLLNNLTRCVYQGWPSLADMKRIIANTDRLFNHSYQQYDKYSNVGNATFNYQKSRFNLIVQAMDALYPQDPNRKYNVQTIFSCENPDQTKTQFGYKYFKTHTFEDPYSSFISWWNSNATSAMKRRILLGGSQLFVGNQAKIIKP